ncbi:baculoviral IAP repeat-containing protein 3-like isoform X1 [Lytechinus variegatus]|uniref:baculoviral IAP repeat-containing protein 3-like isoform X1 n=1 Tax=Lytechinus variegatus TaxID=7654 RepID=UPI001BB20B9B|nr:baculoviral IAP repeat-containing protein 3-like isoform X1 [Lytechinus variegatus]
MSTDVCLQFNGQRQSLKSILCEIKPDLYTMKEGLEIMELHKKFYDEADCHGPASMHSSEPRTLPDGRICVEKLGSRGSSSGMNKETNRLATFQNWPENSPVNYQHLARAGFYFTGLRDVVKCFFCGGEVEGWEYGDTAMGEHKKHFPTCEFVIGRTTSNISLLELNERPEFERKLSSKIEQSQRDIERRAKEKEAMLERSDPSEMKKDLVRPNSASSSFSAMSEQMEEEEESPATLFGKYNQEHVRLQSFKNWPRTSPIEPRDLAKAGFYYVGQDDSVQCFACFGQISRWKPCDVPAVEHKTHFPNCPFVQGLDVGNLPISTPPVMHVGMAPPIRSYSTPGPSPDQLRAGQFLQQQRNLRASKEPLNNCKHPNFVQEAARLGTFRNWPGKLGYHHVTPRVLAKAGFYYTGLVDECKCFYCDGGLKNWEPTDEPWTEHAKWFPRCEWLIQQRGQAFITHVQQVNPPPISSGYKTTTQVKNEPDYAETDHHYYVQPLSFHDPPIGREEPYSQVQPPHSFQTSYQERQPLPSPPLTRSNKEMTIEEEKEAALREYESRHREPEAAAEFNFRPKTKKLEEAEPSDLKSKLADEMSNTASSIDNFMESPTAQMAVEMGYHNDLIRYVVTKHFKKTGKQFSSADDLLESIWEAQGQGIDPTLSVGKAVGGQDLDYLRKPPKELESAAARPSSIVEIQALKLAGLSIHDDDEPPPRRNPSPKTVAPATHIGSLKPQTSVSSSESSVLDKQLCKICLDNELSTVFLPCKHLATCSECAARVTECPMCRQPIIDSLTVYMP